MVLPRSKPKGFSTGLSRNKARRWLYPVTDYLVRSWIEYYETQRNNERNKEM